LRRQITSPRLLSATAAPDLTKLVDDIASLNLIQCRDFVKLLKERLDIPDMAAMPMMMGGGAGSAAAAGGDAAGEAAPAAAEKTAFTVKLKSFNAVDKVKTIKEVRAITKLGLKEAKALVESAPCDVVKDINKKDAEAIIEQLKAAGAVAELE
ncbi:hypothetical protein PBRA_003193, partial [Plasmodiophora brassicae]